MKPIIIAIAMLSLSGCLRTTINFEQSTGSAQYNRSQSFFLGGLIPSKKSFTASELCAKGKIASMETKTTFVNGLLTGLTFGIYAPKTLIVTCTGGSDA